MCDLSVNIQTLLVMINKKSALVAQLVERGTSTEMNTRLMCVAVSCDAEVYGSNPYGSM